MSPPSVPPSRRRLGIRLHRDRVSFTRLSLPAISFARPPALPSSIQTSPLEPLPHPYPSLSASLSARSSRTVIPQGYIYGRDRVVLSICASHSFSFYLFLFSALQPELCRCRYVSQKVSLSLLSLFRYLFSANPDIFSRSHAAASA